MFVVYLKSGRKVFMDSLIRDEKGNIKGIRSAKSGSSGKVDISEEAVEYVEEWQKPN